ncbi:MAG: YkgJ family cysteine cluster protein [Desulfobacteraceae bacterium]|nr:YkgJ family cysteine cluster protein [Desulfobacteraceae bacterium]
MDQIKPLLKDYQALVKRVDVHIAGIQKIFPDRIACKKGCDRCCRSLTLFPVEAFSLSYAHGRLPEDIKAKIGLNLEKAGCPLLIDRECVLYPFRPIICRTHGYPIYMEKRGRRLIDFCPDNFKDVASFPKETLLHLDQLNTLLTAINRQFIGAIETDPPLLDRIPISEAIFILSH